MKLDRPLIDVPAWFDIMAEDPEAARAFYGPLLGWTFEIGDAAHGAYSTARRNGLAVAGIGKKPTGSDWPNLWTIYFGVADIEATARAVGAHGGEVVVAPMEITDAGYMAICIDPAGAMFGLRQGTTRTGVELVDEPGCVIWSEVNSRDGAAARDFYAAVFGLTYQQDASMSYWILAKDGAAVLGILQMNDQWPENVPSHWMPYFGVPDANLIADNAPDLGGATSIPPFDSPFGRLAVLNDPSGAVLSIMCPDQK